MARRKRLTPIDAVEQFELRIACYFEADGSTTIHVDTGGASQLHEVLGALEYAKAIILEQCEL